MSKRDPHTTYVTPKYLHVINGFQFGLRYLIAKADEMELNGETVVVEKGNLNTITVQ